MGASLVGAGSEAKQSGVGALSFPAGSADAKGSAAFPDDSHSAYNGSLSSRADAKLGSSGAFGESHQSGGNGASPLKPTPGGNATLNANPSGGPGGNNTGLGSSCSSFNLHPMF